MVDATAALAATLLSPDSSEAEKLKAARTVGDWCETGDPVVNALLLVAQDSQRSIELRCTVVTAIGPILEQAKYVGTRTRMAGKPGRTEKRIQKCLHSLYTTSVIPEIRKYALVASAYAHADWHKAAILAAWGSNDRSWQLAALACMGRAEGFVQQLLDAIRSSDQELACAAVVAAGDIGCEDAWPLVKSLARSATTPKDLLLVIVQAVAYIGQWRSGEVLLPLLESTDPDVVAAAEAALETAGFGKDDYDPEDCPL